MAAYIYYYYFFFHFPRQLCLASKYFESRSLSLGLRFLPHAFSCRPSLFNEHLGQRFFFFCLFVSTASRRFVLQLIFSLSLPSFFLALSSWAFLGTMNRVKGAREKKKTRETMCTFSLLFVFCLQFDFEENGENVCSTFFCLLQKLCVGLHLHPFLQKEL